MPTSSNDGDSGKRRGGGAGKNRGRKNQNIAQKDPKNGTSTDAQSTSSAASSRTVTQPNPPPLLPLLPTTGQKVKILKRQSPPPIPLVACVTPLMDVHLDQKPSPRGHQKTWNQMTEDKVTARQSAANKKQTEAYYFSENPGTAVSADTFQAAIQYTIESFPLERNENILLERKFSLLITPTTSRCNGLHIRVKSQIADDQPCTGALIRLDSDDETIRAACRETIENFQIVLGKAPHERFPFSTKSEEYLKSCYIRRLDERQDAFPEAIYYCEKCDYHITTIGHAKAHLESSTHFDDIRRQEQRETLLKKIPKPTNEHLKSVEHVLRGVLDQYQETRKTGVMYSDRIMEYLKTTVFPSINAQNFVLRPFGSATYDVVLPDSDYNIAYTMDLPEGLPIFSLLEQIRKKIDDDGYPAEHSMEMGTPSTILFHFEGVRVRLCWMSCFNHRSQLYLSDLMKKYVDLREEVVEFLQLIRLWACKSEVDSKNRPRIGLPRYGFDLMAIHFLQQSGYLPVLHELFEGEMEEDQMNLSRDDGSEIPEEARQRRIRLMSKYEKDLEKIKRKFDLKKEWNHSELFIQFFRYYVQNHKEGVIQITQMAPMSRDINRWNKKILHVVDPFRGDNVLSIPKVSTWQPYYFNCLLTTYLSFAIPRTKNGAVVEIGLIHNKTSNSKKKIKETPKRPDPPPPTVIPKPIQPISEEDYQTAADELADEMEEQRYLEQLKNRLIIDGIRYQNRKPDDWHVDDHLEKIYSSRALLRFRRTLDTGLNDQMAIALDDHDLLTKKGRGWIKKWKKRTGYGSITVEHGSDAVVEEMVAEITEKLEQKVIIFDHRPNHSIAEAPLTKSLIDREMSSTNYPPDDAPESTKQEPPVEQEPITEPLKKEDQAPPPPPPPPAPKSTLHKTIQSMTPIDKQICMEEFFIKENIGYNEIQHRSKSIKEGDYVFEFTPESFCGNFEMEMRCTHCDGSHCVEKCPMMEIPPIKKYQARSTEELKDIDAIIDKYYEENILDEKRMEMMESKRKELEKYLREQWNHEISLTIFGSVMTGLSVKCSDIDICLRFGEGDVAPKDMTPKEVILKTESVLSKCSYVKRVQAIVTAKVPIVKFQLRLKNGEIVDADISYYNILAIYNTALLREYTLWTPDHRFAKLALFIKKWAKSCDIGDASRGSLSSYAHIILLISYLQHCDPPVLPRLQDDFRDDSGIIEKRLVDNWDTSYAQVEPQKLQKWPKNKETCAQLLIGYFDYYSRYDFRNFVVQCRRPMILSKMEKDWPRPLCVEDPFDLNHNLSSGVTKKMFVFIMKVFINSRAVFMSENPTVERNDQFIWNYQHQLLKKCHQGTAPTDRQCHMCHKIGHFVESCPQRLQKDTRRRYGSNSTNSSYRSMNDHTIRKSEDGNAGGGRGGGYGVDRLTSHKRTYYKRK